MSTGANGPAPGQGMVVRVEYNGHLTTIASGFTFPTAMTFGPDGSTLYVTNLGFGFPAGSGQVVTVKVTN
jgi:sugar lactone lactonase YvrE